MPNGDVVPIGRAHERAESKAHDAHITATVTRLRAEADYLENPSKKARRALDSAREVERTLGRRFRAKVRQRVDAEAPEA